MYKLSMHQAEAALKMFVEFDKNADGVISPNEFFELIQSLSKGKKSSAGMLQRMSNMYFVSADKDSSGDINFDEFLELYSRLEKL